MMKELQKRLGISYIPPRWNEFYDEVKQSFEERSRELLDRAKIAAVIDECKVMVKQRERILSSAAAIEKNEDLRLFLCLIEKSMEKAKNDELWEFPTKDEAGYDLLPLFALIPTIPQSIAKMRALGFDEDTITKTVAEYDDSLTEYMMHNGDIGFDVRLYNWMLRVKEARLFRAGRLNFEIIEEFEDDIRVFSDKDGNAVILSDGAKVSPDGRIAGSAGCGSGGFSTEIEETEEEYIGHPVSISGLIESEKITLSKKLWSVVLKKGDPVVGVHIPSFGEFSDELCEESFRLGRETLGKLFPDFDYKAFTCESWLLDPRLSELLRDGSSIVAFQKRFMPYARKSDAETVFDYVFMLPFGRVGVDYTSLAEKTTLQRKVKELYLDGGYIYEFGGIILKDRKA